jgi:hypothetical protein
VSATVFRAVLWRQAEFRYERVMVDIMKVFMVEWYVDKP